jgi:hypothetical protein
MKKIITVIWLLLIISFAEGQNYEAFLKKI